MQFLALGDGTVELGYMDYSFDGSNWTNVRSSQTIQVSKYQVLYIKTDVPYYTLRNFTFDFYVRGNMALSFTSSYSFRGMFENNTHAIGAKYFIVNYLNSWGQYMFQNYFKDCTNLVTAPQLPATTLGQGCYQQMFYNCTSLKEAPELNAMSLTDHCYSEMFFGCSSIITPPELPATTLAEQCYYQCFQNCANMETAPELNAVSLPTQCYLNIFNNCSKIDYIKMLGIVINQYALTGWADNVAQTGTLVLNINIDMYDVRYDVPANWTVIYYDQGRYWLDQQKSHSCDENGNPI